ncbi:Uncharacterised protein [Vibrio cholerae]|nr:Uncharacterised protein [Vibrio cholerae]
MALRLPCKPSSARHLAQQQFRSSFHGILLPDQPCLLELLSLRSFLEDLSHPIRTLDELVHQPHQRIHLRGR